eukprot:TRINITY_DN60676_c0_g1_i1.p1 TRINITY_DN60676_c0_g1~~TRINITY_DN60676_c0_g1_i1.p1  ORF type:complete len:138 (-),score=27.35 TRINITY_DN60676_c0_g1_i1:94-507(-)
MQRGLVGSEMCIRDRYQRRVHGAEYMGRCGHFAAIAEKCRSEIDHKNVLDFVEQPHSKIVAKLEDSSDGEHKTMKPVLQKKNIITQSTQCFKKIFTDSTITCTANPSEKKSPIPKKNQTLLPLIQQTNLNPRLTVPR